MINNLLVRLELNLIVLSKILNLVNKKMIERKNLIEIIN